MGSGALTKAEMAERLFDEMGLTNGKPRKLVEQFFEEDQAVAGSNEQVKLSGFGNFDLRDKTPASRPQPKDR